MEKDDRVEGKGFTGSSDDRHNFENGVEREVEGHSTRTFTTDGESE